MGSAFPRHSLVTAHDSHRLLTLRLKTCSLFTLLTTRAISFGSYISLRIAWVICITLVAKYELTRSAHALVSVYLVLLAMRMSLKTFICARSPPRNLSIIYSLVFPTMLTTPRSYLCISGFI